MRKVRNTRIRAMWEVVRETLDQWMSDGVSQLAAALAFYTIFSLSPILVILIALVGALYGEDTARLQILAQAREFVGPRGAQIIETTLADAYASSGAATIFGIMGLLFGATVVFVSLQHALNTIWAVAPKPGWRIWPFFRKRLLSFLMVVGLGLLVLLSLVASTAVAAVGNFTNRYLPLAGRLLGIMDLLLWFGILTLCFAVIYKVLPDVKIRWRDVWVGSAAAAVLFTLGKALIAAYLARSTTASAFGAASSLAVLLVWVYYSAQIFLLCGEFTQVYARRFGIGIIPDDNSVRVLKTFHEAEG